MPENLTIGMVVDNEFYGDPRVYNEAKVLVQAGYRVKVLCLNFGSYPDRELVDGIELVRVRMELKKKKRLSALMLTLPFYRWFWRKAIHQFIMTEQIEVLHVHDLYMARMANEGISRNYVHVILDLHENYPAAIMGYNWATRFPACLIVRPWLWKKLEEKYLGFANKIILISNDFKQDLLNRFPYLIDRNLVVYPNVPDLDELLTYPINPVIEDKAGRFFLFYFGGIAERRGIFTCFEALKLLVKKYPTITLLLVGPVDKADKARFDHYMKDPSLASHVIHYPWKDISTLPSYITISDVCLSPLVKNPQHESGIANKVFQYMLFERPVIVSDCKPQQEVIENEHCGLVFRSEDPSDLALQIETLYTHPEMIQQMGINGRQAALSKYNVGFYRKNLEGLYSEFLINK